VSGEAFSLPPKGTWESCVQASGGRQTVRWEAPPPTDVRHVPLSGPLHRRNRAIDTVELRDAADRYLETCFERETPPHVRELAASIGLSFNYLSRIFRTRVGVSASSYLKNAQMERAKRLLTSTSHPIASVGSQCGYGTPQTFYKVFRRRTGMTPAEYRLATADK
jgi:AraC-like DNA-binding protein